MLLQSSVLTDGHHLDEDLQPDEQRGRGRRQPGAEGGADGGPGLREHVSELPGTHTERRQNLCPGRPHASPVGCRLESSLASSLVPEGFTRTSPLRRLEGKRFARRKAITVIEAWPHGCRPLGQTSGAQPRPPLLAAGLAFKSPACVTACHLLHRLEGGQRVAASRQQQRTKTTNPRPASRCLRS